MQPFRRRELATGGQMSGLQRRDAERRLLATLALLLIPLCITFSGDAADGRNGRGVGESADQMRTGEGKIDFMRTSFMDDP